MNDIHVLTDPNFTDKIYASQSTYMEHEKSIEMCKRIFKVINKIYGNE